MTKPWLKKAGIFWIATGGFSGLFPIAPGTAGTLVGAALVWVCRDLPLALQVLLTLALLFLGAWASGKAGRFFKDADSGHIVIDEIVGIMITMLAVPVTGYWLACGFVVFRFLDIAKLPPAHFFDARMKTGWGVMLDDVVSGVYANLWLHLMLRAAL